ncbi:prolyl oligopeptidase family serine peptidase [Idiomarina seosinensis]|uniref:prolyl oligopeptidase n=1 Tax=Idiomarina seosinensis TaxID=281739 RepID=A0A432Z4E2_9GAMM|nr:prolyl oligopeptidase family serine peptidase [Idiomarina seosinensis]RUO72751.1 S9 family peptidase [Idiomarina seosinensis]
MKQLNRRVALTFSLLLTACSTQSPPEAEPKLDQGYAYPQTERQQHSQNYHGIAVEEPYRWLEAGHKASVSQWTSAQTKFADNYLQQLSANRFIKERLAELWNVEQTTAPIERGGKIFYLRNNGLQNQPILYLQEDLNAAPKIAVDPNAIDPTGLTAMVDFSVSPNGRYLAYALSSNGTDWKTWRIKDLNRQQLLDEAITGTKFTNISWYPDSKGFYYSRYPKTDNGYDDQESVEVYYHSLNSDQHSDIQVTEITEHPGENPYPEVSSDGKYLMLRVQQGPTRNAFYIRPLNKTKRPFQLILEQQVGNHQYLASYDGHLYFHSVADGGLGQIIRVSADNWQASEQVVAAQDYKLQSASIIGQQIFAHYLDDAHSRLITFDLSGKFLRELALPGLGTISGFNGDTSAKQTFFKFSSFTQPGKIYRYHVADQHTSLWRDEPLPVDPERYQTQQVVYRANDGTRIPMFLVSAKDTLLNGKNPTLLHGYGGFGQSLTPAYHAEFMAWLELGGVLAIPNIRGGGEFGSGWHQAAVKHRKTVAVEDFVAAARWLIDNDYTASDKLAIHGRGHGGLIVAAAMTRYPGLFAAALPEVGLYDMLRYHTANSNALGWQNEFGISSNDNDFRTLYAYSPLHNVTYGQCYPATLISTGLQDQRVAPWHSYKFAAQLQYAQGCPQPIILDIAKDAGHGTKNPTWMEIEQTSKQWSFALNQLGVDWLKKLPAE